MHLLYIILLFPFCSCKFDLKPGTKKNKLFSEYGINLRCVSGIKNRLDRVLVVTSIPILRFIDLHINTIHIGKCSLAFNNGAESIHNGLGVAINKWCAKAVHYMDYLKVKKKYYMKRLHDLLEEDIYAALPEPKPHVVTRSRHRSKRIFGVLIE